MHNDPAIIHDKDLICIHHFFHIMSDQDHSHIFFSPKLFHCMNYFFSSIWIQHGSRFIQYNAFRLHCDHSCDRHPLLLTA